MGQTVNVMVASDDVAEQEYRQGRPVIGCDGDTLRPNVMLPQRELTTVYIIVSKFSINV